MIGMARWRGLRLRSALLFQRYALLFPCFAQVLPRDQQFGDCHGACAGVDVKIDVVPHLGIFFEIPLEHFCMRAPLD